MTIVENVMLYYSLVVLAFFIIEIHFSLKFYATPGTPFIM